MRNILLLTMAMVGLSLMSCNDNGNNNQIIPPPIDTNIVDTNFVDTNTIDTAGTLIGVWDIVAIATFPNRTPVKDSAYIIFSKDSVWVYYGYKQNYVLNDKGTYHFTSVEDSLYVKFEKNKINSCELINHIDTLEIRTFIQIYPSFYEDFPPIMIKRRP